MSALVQDRVASFGEAWTRLTAAPFAHRGLWSPDGAPENSLSAFQHAAERGFGVELDVRLSADGEAMVFHDETLERMTGRAGRVGDHRASDLQTYSLNGGDDAIPTLAEALTVIGAQAMVLIELKTPSGEVGRLEQRVHDVLIDHHGPLAVIGFNAYSHAWFAERHPKVLRGLNSHAFVAGEGRLSREAAQSQRRLEHVSTAKPHFLALGLDMLPSPEAAKLRAKGMPVVGWTLRGQEECAVHAESLDNYIFEGFVP